MTIASSKRLGGLALATTLLVAACGGGGATTAPASEAAATDAGAIRCPHRWMPAPRPAAAPSRARSTSPARPPSSRSRRPSPRPSRPPTRASTTRSRAPAPATASSVLRRRDRHQRRVAQDQGRGGRDLQDRRHRLRRAQDRVRRHDRHDLAGQHGRHLPQLRRPLRPDRAGVARASPSGATPRRSPRSSARTPSSRTPPWRSPAPVRSPARSTASSSSPSRRSPRRRPPPTRRHDAPRLHGDRPTTTRSSRASPAPPSSLGWVGFAFAQENKDKVKELEVSKDPNGTCVAPTRRHHHRRQLPALPHPVHLRQQGQGRRQPGRRRLRRLLPGRRHDLDGPPDRPVRQPPGRQALHASRRTAWDAVQVASSPPALTGSGQLGARPVRLSLHPHTQPSRSLTTRWHRRTPPAPARHLAEGQPRAGSARERTVSCACSSAAALLSIVHQRRSSSWRCWSRRSSFLQQIDLSPAVRGSAGSRAAGIFDIPTLADRHAHRDRHRDAHRHSGRAGVAPSTCPSTPRPQARRHVKPVLEILAGIPSVVLGFFALTLISPNLDPAAVRRGQRRSTCSPRGSASAS